MANPNPLTTLLTMGGAPSHSSGGFLGKVAHGVSHGLANLGSDVLHTATGLPGGVVHMVEHPIASAEAVGKSTWHDWSPLFHGHVGQFAHQTYDHPLAPLLDVATVFTGGAGALAKVGGKLAEEGTFLGDLGKAGKIDYTRPTHFTEKNPGLAAESKTTSTNPLVRARQNMVHNTVASLQNHLPKLFGDESALGGHVMGNAAQYQRITLGKMLGRHAAMNAQNADTVASLEAQVAAMLHAGKVLSTEDGRKAVFPSLLQHNYFNLRNHAILIKPGDALPAGYTYVREFTQQNGHKMFGYSGRVSPETVLRNLGRRYTVRDVKQAARNANGRIMVVPKHDMNSLGIEGANTASMMMKLWSRPSHLWKMAVVGYSPKMVVNNAVGNWLMYAMKQSGAHGARGVVDAIRYAKSEKAALHAVKDGSITAKQYLDRSWMQRHFRDEIHPGNSFMGSTLQKEGALGLKSGLKQGLHPLVHKIADQPVRVAAIHSYLRGAPEIKAAMGKVKLTAADKAKGISVFDKAVDKTLSSNKGLRERTAEHARTIAGNYTRMTPKEQIVRQIIPFYAWDKHIAKHASNLLSENPGRVLGLESLGQQGSDRLKGKFGALPDYMLNELPIGIDHSTGRQKMLDARGLNPYSSAGELAAGLLGDNTAGFDSIASQINPIASTLFGLLGQSASDAARGGGQVQAKGQGLAGLGLGTAAGAFGNIPELRLIQDAMNGKKDNRTTKAGTVKPMLNERNIKDDLLNYLAGIPVKRVDMAHASQLQAQATGQKKKSALQLLLGG